MALLFDIKKTGVSWALQWASFPLIKYAGILSQVFFLFFLGSLALIGSSYAGLILQSTAIKVSIFSLVLVLVFLELSLFLELKLKKHAPKLLLKDALTNGTANFGEFLSLNGCQIIQEAMRIAKKRKMLVSPTILLKACLKNNNCALLLYRLGITGKPLERDLKNYLEKQAHVEKAEGVFSDQGMAVVMQAANIAVARGRQTIGEKEILAALAKHDAFFKKVMVENDLKEQDVENITLWLGSLEEKLQKRKEFWTTENLARFGSLGRELAAGFTITLDQFSIDLTKLAANDILAKTVGHEKEIASMEVILTKPSHTNVLLIGEPGSGRKSIVRELARRCFLKLGMPELAGKKVVELDMVALASRIQNQEKLEATLDQIFQEALAAGNIILVINQLDRFVEQKVAAAGQVDISGILAKYLALPEFRFIGITSFDGLHRNLEKEPALLEYFQKIEVQEVSESDTIEILQNMVLSIEYQYKILILYPAIREIINLTARYFPSLPFPKKAIDVLDEALAYARSKKAKVILPSDIARIISDKTQIPIGKMEFKEKSVLLDMEKLIHQRIIGQEEAVAEISVAMRRARSGLGSKKRPMGVFLFLGPTGVGKTETAKALADIYFDGQEKMIRLDMSEFQQISDIPRLVGRISPVEEPGLLTTPVRENPFSLILLDEIEKAHPNILNLFLQVFDEGHITDGQGRKVVFTNTIIICTSNAGASMIFEMAKKATVMDKDKILATLFEKGIFRPEFVNRFDAAVLFHPLSKDHLLQIAGLILAALQKNLKEKEIHFTITEALKERIAELSYKPEFGAREMRRVIQDRVENAIAKALLSDQIVKGDSIEVDPETFKVVKVQSETHAN